jgi:hypothetical protein
MTRRNKSGRHQIIENDAAPPELPPMAPRPSGSLVKVTARSGFCAFTAASTAGSSSLSAHSAYRPDTVSYSSPRSLPTLSPPPLPAKTTTMGGIEPLAIRLSKTAGKEPSKP